MKNDIKVGIVGLGMMGCSLAYSLSKSKNISSITGCDTTVSLEDLHKNNIFCVKEIIPLEQICHIVDVLFLIIPPEAIIKILPSLKDVDHITIIDFASVKKDIVLNIPKNIRANFIASHPMCGNEKSGPNGYEKNLYKNKTLILCDTSQNNQKHLDTAKDIFKFLNMKIIFMDSITHDEHIGYISHLPHVVSFALANSILNQSSKKNMVNLRGGGFESMVRLAKSNSNLWRDIFKSNSKNLSSSLKEYDKQLQIFRRYLEDEDYDNMQKWILKANTMQNILL